MSLSPLLPLLAPLLLLQPTSPLLNYQEMQKLKETLAQRIVEVQVVAGVPDGADPTIAPQLVGQGVCLAGPDGAPVLFTSAYLVENAQSLAVRTRSQPQWRPARQVWRDDALGVARLAAVPGETPFACPLVEPAIPALEAAGSLVFSIDNPTQWTSIFWGYVAGYAEPPLTAFLLTRSGLPLGGPLLSADGRLVALNLRHYTPQAPTHLAATATQLLRSLFSTRRAPAAPQRRPRRGAL